MNDKRQQFRIDLAVGNSAGSLSPRVKWESLKGYEFELPELAEQDGLVELLKAAHRTKKAYQKQITATDELVKSQFIGLGRRIGGAVYA